MSGIARAGNKETRRFIKAIEKAGAHVEIGGTGHWKISVDGHLVTTIAASSSDWRARKNAIAQLRRAGLEIELER